jgi:urease accessory protein
MTTPVATAHSGIEVAVLPRPAVDASLQLGFSHDPFTGRTILADSHQCPPLKVVRAFHLEDGSALAHLHNVSGGVLGGDRLAMSVHVASGAKVQLTTTGATRIYRPRENATFASQQNEITVAENGFLEYVADPIIPFAGARYSQRTRIHLSNGAGLFWWEILAPGREARREIFEYEWVEMRTDVLAMGWPIASERIRLEPCRRNVSELARLGPYRYWASFYICRVGVSSKVWLAAEQHLREKADGLRVSGELLIGISTLVAHGLAVRILARHGRGVLPPLYAMWNAAKHFVYGSEAVPPRKVN